MRVSEYASTKECEKRKNWMKSTTSMCEGKLYFERIYNAEYFAVLRERRIRMGVADGVAAMHFWIFDLSSLPSHTLRVMDTRRVVIVYVRFTASRISDVQCLYFVEHLKSPKITIRILHCE